MELANKYYSENNYHESSKLFMEIIESGYEDSYIYYDLGFALYKIAESINPSFVDEDNSWEEYADLAIENFTKSIELDPENEYAYMRFIYNI